MELKFECPACGQHISATPAHIGVTAPCPNCNTAVTVPNPSPQPQSPPAANTATAKKSKPSVSPRAVVSVALIVGIPVLVVMCVNNVSKESQERARERIAAEQRENQEGIKNHHALIGMTAAQVRQAWGEPKRIVRTTDERATYEEWHYGSDSKGATLYFVNGIFKSGTRNDGK
jgi:hypothetical protein